MGGATFLEKIIFNQHPFGRAKKDLVASFVCKHPKRPEIFVCQFCFVSDNNRFLMIELVPCSAESNQKSSCKTNKIPKNGQQIKMETAKSMQECLDKVQEKYPTLMNGAVWTQSKQQCLAVIGYTHTVPDTYLDAQFCIVKANGELSSIFV